MNELLGLSELTRLQKSYVHFMKRAGDTLLALINDLLDLSRIESEKVELILQPEDLSRVVDQCADTVSFRAQDKGLELLTILTPKLIIKFFATIH